MQLSSDLISQFVKATKDEKPVSTETTLHGTIVYDGKPYVKLDGSDLLTPVTTTTDVQNGERVTVLIKNHTATVTGNISSPAARTDDVQAIGNQISEFEIIVADKVSVKDFDAQTGRIDQLVSDNVTIRGELDAHRANIDELTADNVKINETLTANEASIKKLETDKLSAELATLTYAKIEDLDATNANVNNLNATYGEFEKLATEEFAAIKADIEELDTEKLTAEQANLKYVNIDFANINEAWFDEFYAKSGIIQNVTISEGVVVKELIGVTIKGDLIEAGTLKADRLVVKGSDGQYYKLNTDFNVMPGVEPVEEDAIHGSVLIANSITAEKISVDDLVAFDATIGGFHITRPEDDKPGAIYSGVKESVGNTTRGIYLDSEGQMAIGDETNYLKYFKDTDGKYKLAVAAGSVILSASNKTVEEVVGEVDDKLNNMQVGARNLIRNSTNLMFANYYFSGELAATYDGIGELTITRGASASVNNEGDVVIRTSATCTDDGSGNVTLM